MNEEPEIINDTITTDLSEHVPQQHSFDHIIGNELRCSIHGTCAAIFVRPTQILERTPEGGLILVEMSR